MNKFSTTFIIIFFMVFYFSNAQNENYNNVVDSIKIDNTFRGYESYIPKDISKHPKLVFVLHGSTLTTKQIINLTGNQFNQEPNASNNRIIVYLQGFEN